jgi:hypothetical protein
VSEVNQVLPLHNHSVRSKPNMSQQNNQPLPPNQPNDDVHEDNFIENEQDAPPAPPSVNTANSSTPAPTTVPEGDEKMGERLERLGGEPAPVITPEEFARLQQAGQVHIDARGRVRTARRSGGAEAGVSLRKRRAWYERRA